MTSLVIQFVETLFSQINDELVLHLHGVKDALDFRCTLDLSFLSGCMGEQ